MKISDSLSYNLKILQKEYDSDDVIFYTFKMHDTDCVAVYVDSVIDKDFLGKYVLKPLQSLPNDTPIDVATKSLSTCAVEKISTFKDATEKTLDGNVLIYVDGQNQAICVDLKKYETRAVAEPPTSTVIRGPREGFNECLKTNLSLVRRRIKSNDLKIKMMQVGRYTKTAVAVIYISSVADDELVEKIQNRISKIDVDGAIDSSYISKFLVDKKTSVFKQTGSTEKPDVLTAKLLEGRVAILVDGSPIAVSLPYMLIEDFQSAEDYYTSVYRANVSRALRLISVAFSVLLPSFFVAAQLFHLQLIPLNFLLTIVNSIKGIPLSPSYEMFFTLLIFEILNEASVRMPRYVGMAVSIVGALVLGDTAVTAGIVSTPTIMIMALSGICLYTVPDLIETMSVIRLIFLIIGGSVGGYGILVACAFIVIYLSDSDSYGAPLTAPYSPIVKKDLKDGFLMKRITDMKTRPFSYKRKPNDNRIGGNNE